MTLPGRWRLWKPLWILASLVAVACGAARHGERRGGGARPTRQAEAPSMRQASDSTLYAADEALGDTLSGPLEYLGTGKWPGIRRMYACAFRNDRVFVVNVYCGTSERQAFRLDVYSPTRGRARIYAESKGFVSAQSRQDYFTFMAESEPAPGPEAHLPPLALTMSFQDLRTYEEQRYSAFFPACYGGQELKRARGGCLGALAPRATEWASRNRDFLDRASDDWYRVVRELSALAARYGKEPE